MGNKRAVIVGGALAYLGVSYGVYKALKPKAAPLASFTPRSDNTQVWDAVATRYDAEIDFDETLVGVKLLRWWLLRNVSGKTLEVSAGTARNLQYYSNKVDSVTITDRSPEMVSVAYAKAVGTMSPEKLKRFTFRTADAKALPFPDDSFDTIVHTFGLCSESDPETVLSELQRVCKPDGKILLLEHGRSGYFGWLNSALDDSAPSHAEKWGCWWNKDIDTLVKSSGMTVDYLTTWHFGTTYYVIGKPNKPASVADTLT